VTSVAGVEHATALRPIDPVVGASDFHFVDTDDGPHLLVVDGSLFCSRSTRISVSASPAYLITASFND
jgi:hypothetical protein